MEHFGVGHLHRNQPQYQRVRNHHDERRSEHDANVGSGRVSVCVCARLHVDGNKPMPYITHFYSLSLSLSFSPPLPFSLRLDDLTGLERPALPPRPPHSSPVRSSRASLTRKAERTSERELDYQQSTEGCVFSFEIFMLTYTVILSLFPLPLPPSSPSPHSPSTSFSRPRSPLT